ncbi:MAG: glycosyltransferase [Candidatus Micrarchaeaceae archaeon]
MQESRKTELSVVIPTIEEEGVFDLINSIRKLFGSGTEIIVVDKSSDAYFKKLQNTGVLAIKQRGSGVERAVAEGMRLAHGEIIATIDGDGTHEVDGLKKAVNMIKKGNADIVLGNRLAGLQKGSMTTYVRIGNMLLSWLFSKLYKVDVHDILTGLFAVRASAFNEVKNIEPYRAGVATTYAIEMLAKGYKLAEININYYKRKAGTSRIAKHKTGYALNVAANIIRQVRDYNPLLIFGLFGIVLFVAGLLIGIAVLLNFAATGQFTEVGRALIAFMLAVLGILSIFVGIILDLLLEVDKEIRELKAK